MRLEPLPGGGLRALACAKVNLHLAILGLREDGYHEVDTVMQEISLHDELELRPAAARPGSLESPMLEGPVRLVIEPAPGLPSAVPLGEDNLVLRAARLLEPLAHRRLAGPPPPVEVRLRKRIPTGAGLGGGSSDAAAALVALSTFWGLGAARDELSPLAEKLGSDVAFFLWGGLARCQGRGERVSPLDGTFRDAREEELHFVLACPRLHVSTPLIYKELDRMQGLRPGLTTRSRLDTMCPLDIWRGIGTGELLYNELQPVACQVFPELEAYLEEFRKERFRAALMSGSGSTIYGLVGTPEEAAGIAARLRKRLGGDILVVGREPAFRWPGS